MAGCKSLAVYKHHRKVEFSIRLYQVDRIEIHLSKQPVLSFWELISMLLIAPTPQKMQTTASIKAFFLSDLCLYVLYYDPPLFQEHEGKPLKLPFFTDLCLSLSLLTHSLLNVMYHGPANSQAEDACQHLLDSKLLQR